ncbi:hypothetical protein BGZ58_004205 [Dissophora ornata]|nr:hypothetical protein BGZ58_004205 [Dissophora ornata]
MSLDLEAAVLSCYNDEFTPEDKLRASAKLLPKLKRLLSSYDDKIFVRYILHGYMVDAWTYRECYDEFLTLNATWPLTTDAYLKLIGGLDLHGELLAVLLAVSGKERALPLKLIIESPEFSTELLTDLFLWSMDIVISECCKIAVDGETQNGELPLLVDLWTARIKESDYFRQLFRASFVRILNQLFVRLIQRKPTSLKSWRADQGGFGSALEVIQGLVNGIAQTLIQSLDDQDPDLQQFQDAIKRWDSLVPGFSDFLPAQDTDSALGKQCFEAQLSLKQRLQMRLQEDLEFARSNHRVHHTSQGYDIASKQLDDHQRAFITICANLRQHQDLPEYPPSFITRLAADTTLHKLNQGQQLSEHIAWIESTIQNQAAGWRSCVKLKIQFFAVFDESAINEGFADEICVCDLHWELCTVLQKYLKRHLADPARMPFETFQLGCELLLSVFSKKEQMQCQLRDHLYMMSRTICKNMKDPLFGSWELWRIDVDVQLIATLNQVVATKGSTIPRSTIDSLIKISLIAPYQVVAKIVHNACVNRGQCAVLLQVLVSLGQLPWLRAAPTEPTLLIIVIRDLLCKPTAGQVAFDQQQHRNFVDFVVKAANKKSHVGTLVLNKNEFLVECVIPLLSLMIGGTTDGGFFHSVANIMMELYRVDFSIQGNWLGHGAHFQFLLQLLQLRTLESGWTADQLRASSDDDLGARHRAYNRRRGKGMHVEDISRLGELVVSKLESQVTLMADNGNLITKELIGFFEALNGGLIDLESKLMAVPLLKAGREYLGLDATLPKLPSGMWLLCRNYLGMFEFEGEGPMTAYPTATLQGRGLLRALVLVLDVSRTCDAVMTDIVKALKQATDSLDDQSYLPQILAPVLYRILSVSSRSEGQRLLTRGIPTMTRLWGITNEDFFWSIADEGDPTFHKLSPYWDVYNYGNNDKQELHAGEHAEDGLLRILRISEILLRFALEPLPPRNMETTLEVYRLNLGYDIMADQITSLVLSSIKLKLKSNRTNFSKRLNIEWPEVPLDLVLYSFMTISKLSYIVVHQHMEKGFPNRLSPHSEIIPAAAEVALWSDEYCRVMMQSDAKTERQEAIARSRARDELVLAAMNLSEEIVRRQDAYYKSDMERKHGDGGHGGKNYDPQNEDDPLAHSGTAMVTSNMDGGTQAWFNSIMAPNHSETSEYSGNSQSRRHGVTTSEDIEMRGPGNQKAKYSASKIAETEDTEMAGPGAETSEIQQTASTLSPLTSQGQEEIQRSLEPSTVITTPGVDSSDENMAPTSESKIPKTMISPERMECLNLALEFLPTQERQAVRSRLSRLLAYMVYSE